MGAFLLTAVTGVLLFFEAGVGMVHVAHEWLSWALVLGVFAHVATNWASFTTYFVQKRATAIPVLVVFVLLLGASFFEHRLGRATQVGIASDELGHHPGQGDQRRTCR